MTTATRNQQRDNTKPAADEAQLPAEAAKTGVGQVMDFSTDAGAGLEGADAASFAIPFIVVLQSNSPQIETVEGAKPGMFYNTVTGKLSEKIRLVPVAFQRRYNAWAPRASGGGFKGEHSVASVEGPGNELKWALKPDEKGNNVMTLPDGAVLRDTRNHFVLSIDDDGVPQRALLSLASTQIRKSKRWLSLIQTLQMKRQDGTTYTPPSFAHTYVATTVAEENAKGKWKGINIELEGVVSDPVLYSMAKEFHKAITEGRVTVSAPPQPGDEAAAEGEKF